MKKPNLKNESASIIDCVVAVFCILFMVSAIIGLLFLMGCSTPHAVIVTSSPPPNPATIEQISSMLKSQPLAVVEPPDTNSYPPKTNVTISVDPRFSNVGLYWSTNLSSYQFLSNMVTGSLTVPCSGTLFIKGVATNASVHLGWQPDPDTNVVGFNIYSGSISHAYTQKITVGNVTNVTMQVIAAPINYFAATAFYTNGGVSSFSNEAKWTNNLQLAIQ